MTRLVVDILEEAKNEQKKFDETKDVEMLRRCMGVYIELLNDAPDDPEILFQIGTAHLQLGEFGMALPLFDRVLDAWPDNTHVWSNMGCAYRSIHLLSEARDAFIKSLTATETAATYSNLASAYVNEDMPDIGLPYAEKAMEMDGDNAKFRWNAALLYLELERWKEGFSFYDAGFFCGERLLRNYTNDTPDSVQWWDGSRDAKLALWDEQGIGDRLLSANMLRNLEGMDIILECHPRLEGIYRRSFPWINHFYPTSKQDKIDWPPKHEITHKCSVASLAKFYWGEGDFNRESYLLPDPDLVAKYRAEFESYGPGPYYGLSWMGGARKTNTKYRSLKLGWFKSMIERVGGTWISVQYHAEAKDKVGRFRKESGLPIYHCDAAQEKDYDHTLAMLAALDHTVTCCNSVVHTCGAAGLACSVLVPKRRAWRYPKGDTFPWYFDGIKQYHQSDDLKWDSVIDKITEVLIESHDSRTRALTATS